MSDNKFKSDYINEAKVTESKEVKTLQLQFSGDDEKSTLFSMVTAFVLNMFTNKTIVNYEDDEVPDLISEHQKSLDQEDRDQITLENVENIVINISNTEAIKTTVKAVYKILDTKYTDGEFESQPLEEVFGSVIYIQKHLESGDLYFYAKDQDYAFWAYKYQRDIVGSPGDYIVLYGENELEIIRDVEYLLTNYRLPALSDLVPKSE